MEIGDLHFHAATYGSAIDYYRSALRQPAAGAGALDPGTELALRLKLADCCRLQGLLAEAGEELDRARAIAASSSRVESARVDVRRARLVQERGRFREAIELALDAFGVLCLTDRHRDVAAAQMVLGIAHACTGRVAKAEEFFQDALSTYRRIEDVVSQAHVLNNLALLAKRACRWSRALQLYERAEELFHQHGATYESNALLLNKAVLYRKMGQRAEATACALRGLRLARSRGDQSDQARLRLLLGQLSVDEGEFAQAETHLLEARVLAERLDSRRDLALADEFLGDLMAAQHRYDEAEANYRSAEDRARQLSETNDVLTEVRRRQAELALARGENDRALELVANGLALAAASGEEFERGFLLRTRARAQERAGDRQAAVRSYESAVEAFRSQRLAPLTATTLVELGLVLLAEGSGSSAAVARARILEAQRLDDAEGSVDLTEVQFALARAEMALGNLDEAMICLYELERLCDADDPAQVARVDELRSGLDSELGRKAAGVARRFRDLAEMPELEIGGDGAGTDLHAILHEAARRIGARRGLIAARDGAGDVRLLAREGFSVASGRKLAVTAFLALETHSRSGPRVWSAARRGSEWAALGDGVAAPLDAVVAFRLCDPRSGAEALVYFDADVRGDHGVDFDPGAIALATAYVDLLRPALLADGEAPSADTGGFERVVTRSQRMREVLDLCAKVAPSVFGVLFTGETGTGKGLLARLVHDLSPRREGPFVTVNCAAIPEALLESELFGHVKGAFTGAERDNAGLILSARGGTLFLDEVGKMPLSAQAKLLNFLDDHQVRPVGGTRSSVVDVRMLFASKRDLKQLVEQDLLLEDLYYRLLDFPVEVPPLRERGDDVLLLAQTFAERAAGELGRPAPRPTRSVTERLRAHGWPGNVRELEKVVRRAVVLAGEDRRLRLRHLPEDLRRAEGPTDPAAVGVLPLKPRVAELERRLIAEALESLGWNRSSAARQLGISYPTLLQKIRLYGLKEV